ncbi:MAG: YggS family pyridoxal phosphate-dependent enzyme [Actinomycetota bacterium]|nr:YggS family pyridoxal phosphate-dependent enzyme [Actinomycetota bacterium]
MPENPSPSSSPCRSFEELQANLATVRERIAAAAGRAGRDAAEVRLLPVTKTLDDQRIEWAAQAGVRLVGENKAQEALAKDALFERLDLRWAMIGHLQTNKIRNVVGSAVELHSLDRLELAEKLERRLQLAGESLDVFIQVNSSGETSKFGLEPDAVVDFARSILPMHSLRVRGLMTLATNSPDRVVVARCFETMVSLRDRLRQELPDPDRYAELSMGMSGDYELAVEHGATTVRVGQAIFGARPTPDAHYWPPAP